MYKFVLCSRYLRTRYIALASIISVMLGVATMIVVNSVMAGFSSEMRERLHGILADMNLEAMSMDGNPDPEEQMRRVRQVAGEYIESMSPTVEIYGMLSFKWGDQYITRPVTIIGIDPVSKSKVGTLTEHLESYQPVKDDAGRVVHTATRPPDELPNWDLLHDYLAYRRRRNLESRTFLAPARDTHDPATVDEDGNEERTANDGILNRILEDDQPKSDEDLDAPLPARAYVGKQLATFQLVDKATGKPRTIKMIEPGDDVKLSTVNVGRPPQPRHFDVTVVDIFNSGMSEYDSNLVFVNLEELQRIRGMIVPPDDEKTGVRGVRSITTIQIKLKNFADAETVTDRLRSAFPPNMYVVRTWEQKQGPLLAAVDVESTILNVLLFMIIAVAGFGILAIFFMIVVEKTRDIGILKSLGASSRGVMSIFVSYGLSLGLVGSGVGVVVGLLFVRYINEIEKWLTYLTGRKVFDETIYYFPSIPTKVHAMTVVSVALGAVAIAILASILPARRAARLHPVQALRHE